MGLRPLLGAILGPMAFSIAPWAIRWSALIILITTMMVGGNAAGAGAGFQYNGTANLEFFLTQCRVRATTYRVQVLPRDGRIDHHFVGDDWLI